VLIYGFNGWPIKPPRWAHSLIHSRDEKGRTALDHAETAGETMVYQELSEAKRRFTPLHKMLGRLSRLTRRERELIDIELPVPYSAGPSSRSLFSRHSRLSKVLTFDQFEKEMKAIRTIVGQYNEDDIYNMDETGLFWCMPPLRSLSSINRTGIWKDKSRISIICCVNASGSDRLPILVIERAYATSSSQYQYLSNRGSVAMEQKCLDEPNYHARMAPGILSTYWPAINPSYDRQPPCASFWSRASTTSSNVRICWLPKDVAPPPFEQGIIENLMIYYRKQWLRYMLSHYARYPVPLQSATFLHCIRWLVQS
jgi:hypothetical protein